MNERQKKFCEYFAANGGNGSAAAREAGYSERSAREIARKLLTDVDILDYIRKLQDEAAATRIKSVIQTKAFWSSVMDDSTQKMKDRLRASELLAKSAGAFIDPHEETRFECGEVQIYMPYTDRDEGCEIKREKM
ncbi:MAG: terminase small subunit [Anaerotignum sp.]